MDVLQDLIHGVAGPLVTTVLECSVWDTFPPMPCFSFQFGDMVKSDNNWKCLICLDKDNRICSHNAESCSSWWVGETASHYMLRWTPTHSFSLSLCTIGSVYYRLAVTLYNVNIYRLHSLEWTTYKHVPVLHIPQNYNAMCCLDYFSNLWVCLTLVWPHWPFTMC